MSALLLLFIFWGIYSFTQLSVDALPDVTNNQVQVITNSPNLATQEVEQFITFPLETEFKALQGLIELRSTSRSGLSVITLVFKDGIPVNITRQLVSEKVKKAETFIPKNYGSPEIVPPTTGLGEIYQYVIVPKKGFENKFNSMDLRTIQDWIIKRQLLGTPGVVDVSSFGGKLKQYEVSVKPERLAAMKLTLIDVYDALQKNNSNTGGSYIDKGPNIYFIRGEGLIEKLDDINNIVVRNYQWHSGPDQGYRHRRLWFCTPVWCHDKKRNRRNGRWRGADAERRKRRTGHRPGKRKNEDHRKKSARWIIHQCICGQDQTDRQNGAYGQHQPARRRIDCRICVGYVPGKSSGGPDCRQRNSARDDFCGSYDESVRRQCKPDEYGCAGFWTDRGWCVDSGRKPDA